jgi:predicted ATPase
VKKRWSTPGPYLRRVEIDPKRLPSDGGYAFKLPVIQKLLTQPLTFHPKVTFFVGENGSGKSTLLEGIAVACGLNPEGGSVNFQFATKETHSRLHWALNVVKETNTPSDRFFLRAESFYNVATEVERLGISLDPYGGRSPHEQSHGESFFALFQHRFHEHGLYFMDEPEAALSPTRQIAFLSLLHDFVGEGAQFIIATHSPIIMAYPDAEIVLFERTGLRKVAYTETEHYLVTRGFLANPARTFEDLFRPDEAKDEGGKLE